MDRETLRELDHLMGLVFDAEMCLKNIHMANDMNSKALDSLRKVRLRYIKFRATKAAPKITTQGIKTGD